MKTLYLTGILVLSVLLGFHLYRSINQSKTYELVNSSVEKITDQITELQSVVTPFEKSVEDLESNVKNSFLDNNRLGSIPNDQSSEMMVPKEKVMQLQSSLDSLNIVHKSVIDQLSATQQLSARLLDLETECLKPVKKSIFNMESTMGIISLIIGILGLWIAFRQELRQINKPT